MYIFQYPENQSMTSTPQKDAIVFILDVCPSLWRTSSVAEKCKKLINSKIFS